MFLQALCVAIALQSSPRGIVGQQAPSLQGVAWVQSGGDFIPSIEKGKVNYLFFFQSWCPGCHSHGFPTLQKMVKEFPKVNFIAIQTVFEGFSSNTKERALADVKTFGLNISVGHDGSYGNPSPLMRRYRSGGTPWTVIIDKNNFVRFNDFRLTPKLGNEILTTLQAEKDYEILPIHRGGQEMIGTKLSEPIFGNFSAPLTLYRWWTDTCPHCEASLPALDSLREKYKYRGLKVVGVYHPKPPSKTINEQEVHVSAVSRKFNGEVVIDGDWSQLKKWWLESGQRSATSVSILVDNDGIVRFVHPGPVLFPSDDKDFAKENNDFQLLDRAIDTLLQPLKKKEKNDE